MSYDLSAAVGLNDDGSPCTNTALDQQQVAELLLSVPLPFGGLKTSTGPAIEVSTPFADGAISGELIGAIQTFQTVQSTSVNVDLRVEPGSPTLSLLVELATQQPSDTSGSVIVVLDAIADVVEETAPSPVRTSFAFVYAQGLGRAAHLRGPYDSGNGDAEWHYYRLMEHKYRTGLPGLTGDKCHGAGRCLWQRPKHRSDSA